MQYAIRYDAFSYDFSVSLNGQELSADPYSAFSQYRTLSFDKWVHMLLGECRKMANDRYTVSFTGSQLHAAIIECALRADAYFESLKWTKPLITAEHRLAYAVAKRGPMCLADISVYRCDKSLPLPAQIGLGPNVSFGVEATDDVRQSDVVLIKSQADIAGMSLSSPYDQMRAAIIDAPCEPRVRGLQGLFCIMEGRIRDCLLLWYHDMMLPKVLRRIAGLLVHPDQYALLTSQPIYELNALPSRNSRIKVGQTIYLDYFTFPEDIKYALTFSDNVECAKVDGNKLQVHMLREGDVGIRLGVADHAEYPLKSYSFHVYQDHPVTRIHNVRVSKPTIIAGDSFEVAFDVLPANATNLGELKWQLDARGVVGNVSRDARGKRLSCAALSAGQCNLTISFGSVQHVQHITVHPAATGLSTREKSICIKENDQSQLWHVSLEPRDSRGGRIAFGSTQRAVVDVDSDGRLHPHAAGCAEIIAEALDHNGSVKATVKLDVEVLPLHSNPQVVQIMGIGALLLTFGLIVSDFDGSLITGIAALVMLGVSYYKSRSNAVRVADMVMATVAIVLMLLGL